tara:strand:- start:2069 stop:2824 length:756 start_codon:yes stop_codon:yes gene_type:complete
MALISAHGISDYTLLGYTSSVLNYYVDYNNNVRRFDTGEIVAENITNVKDAEKLTIGSPVYGKDIWKGRDMTVKSENQSLPTNIGIAISQMTVNNNSWNISKHLNRKVAIKIVHKWFIEHKWLALYNKQTDLIPMRAFIDWVTGKNFGKLSAGDKHTWYKNAMNIDFEMEKRGCSFEDCLCDIEVPLQNSRNVIPWQYYEDFGLYTMSQMKEIWKLNEPSNENEANIALHRSILIRDTTDFKALIEKIKSK